MQQVSIKRRAQGSCAGGPADFKARGLPAAARYFQDDQLAKKRKQASGKDRTGVQITTSQ